MAVNRDFSVSQLVLNSGSFQLMGARLRSFRTLSEKLPHFLSKGVKHFLGSSAPFLQFCRALACLKAKLQHFMLPGGVSRRTTLRELLIYAFFSRQLGPLSSELQLFVPYRGNLRGPQRRQFSWSFGPILPDTPRAVQIWIRAP